MEEINSLKFNIKLYPIRTYKTNIFAFTDKQIKFFLVLRGICFSVTCRYLRKVTLNVILNVMNI